MPFRPYAQRHHAARMLSVVLLAVTFLLVIGSARDGVAQSSPPLNIFKNYFVTGDYVVAGWVEHSSANGLATGTISVPDCTQAQAMGTPCAPSPVPAGADIVAAYLYWGTVEGNQSTFAGQQAVFNGYNIVGTVLGNPYAPTSWSAGGCTGGSNTGSKTMRFYRADVRPYLPLDLNSSSRTFGAILANPSITVQLADSGSNGNTQPNAMGATLVVIYRVLSPATALNAIVLYDGSYAPSNSMPTMTQTLVGFYQPSINPVAKLTQIAANGQRNKSETVSFGPNPLALTPLSSLYTSGPLGASAPPFPGVYGAWDNPTWNVSNMMSGIDTSETTYVAPTSTNGGCVNWGAMVLSTTVQDSDKDGLLDVWESQGGYTDAVSGQHIALPNADPNIKDLFVEVDYLTARDASGNVLHSHLPKEQTLDEVGQEFSNQGIDVHFDLPAGIYSDDPYVISTGLGGNEIPESSLLCTDPTPANPGPLCEFPNQPAVSWKGGFESVQNDPTLGNFQPGRAQSYRYALFGHSLGEPWSYWGTAGTAFVTNDPADFAYSMPQLVSIVGAGNTATVTLKSPSQIAPGVAPAVQPLVLKPGDCSVPPLPAACADANSDRVTISGALTAPFVAGPNPQKAPPLNGTYKFFNARSTAPDANGIITTTFQITTSGVPDGTYNFSNEPQLGVSYLGPTSSSGHADFSGGGDLAVTLGLWGADDVAGCQPDPSLPGQTYCNNQVGTLNVQIGTLMHELGHTLTLTHGGTYYNTPNDSSLPTYEMNCKPNFVSVMNYLFQIRGFVDGGFDYSGQTLAPLNEATLSESTGLGSPTAEHLTRWYSKPNATDLMLHNQANAHCDGSPLAAGEAPEVRVDGTVAPGGTFSAPLDWNNDLMVPDAVAAPGIDLNHNGILGDAPFSGFDDWQALDLQQMNGRASGFGFSEGGGLKAGGGGGLKAGGGGGVDAEGGGLKAGGGGGLKAGGGGGLKAGGGGGIIEEDAQTANATVSAPSGLTCTQSLTASGTVVPGCSNSSGSFVESGKSIPLTWTPPDFGQIRSYTIWRALGSFTTAAQVSANISQFSKIATLTGTPPSPSFIDSGNLKNNKTYTYFVADTNSFQANSGASFPLVVTVKP